MLIIACIIAQAFAVFAIIDTIHHKMKWILFDCPFCISRQVSIAITPFTILASDLSWWIFPVLTFASAGLSNIINDWLWPITKIGK